MGKMSIAVAILGLVSGCSGLKIYTDYDPTLNFSRFQTYAWMPQVTEQSGDFRVDNDLVQKRLRRAVDTQLQSAGFRLVDESEASFFVSYRALMVDKTQISSSGGSIGYGRWNDGRYGSVAYGGGVDSYDYTQGTVILDIIDPKSMELVWRGTAEQTVEPKLSPQEREQRINQAYQKMLERFPPGKEK